MAAVAAPPMTADEFYAFVHRPENRDRVFELERGEVVENALEGVRHGFVCANVAYKLANYAHAVGRGFACANRVGLVIAENPDSVCGPDLAYFADASPLDDPDAFARTPPVLAVEVLSGNDRPEQVDRRVRGLLRFGVAMVWLVDAESATVTLYRRGREFVVLAASETVADDAVLPGFRCRVADFFALPGR